MHFDAFWCTFDALSMHCWCMFVHFWCTFDALLIYAWCVFCAVLTRFHNYIDNYITKQNNDSKKCNVLTQCQITNTLNYQIRWNQCAWLDNITPRNIMCVGWIKSERKTEIKKERKKERKTEIAKERQKESKKEERTKGRKCVEFLLALSYYAMSLRTL